MQGGRLIVMTTLLIAIAMITRLRSDALGRRPSLHRRHLGVGGSTVRSTDVASPSSGPGASVRGAIEARAGDADRPSSDLTLHRACTGAARRHVGRSPRDAPAPSHAGQAARQARRLPAQGRPRPRALRGQGAEPAQPRAPVLAGRPRRAGAAAHRVGHRPRGRRRVHADRHASARRCCSRPTSSSATSRASTSASRTTSPTRSSRSRWATTSRASSARASCPTTAAATSGRTPRASSVDEAMNLIRRLFPFRTCTIDDQRRQARAARGPACCTTSSAARAPASRPSARTPTAPTSTR